jgi:hypothetical protein
MRVQAERYFRSTFRARWKLTTAFSCCPCEGDREWREWLLRQAMKRKRGSGKEGYLKGVVVADDAASLWTELVNFDTSVGEMREFSSVLFDVEDI